MFDGVMLTLAVEAVSGMGILLAVSIRQDRSYRSACRIEENRERLERLVREVRSERMDPPGM